MEPQQNFRLVLAGHGSRSEAGYEEFERFVALFRECYPQVRTWHGYLEFNRPTIEEALLSAVSEGSGPVIVVPGILAAATHVKNDLPLIIQSMREKFPSEDIRFASVLDLHPKLLNLCSQRISAAEAAAERAVRREDTCLVVVGRGTSDPDANGDIAKLTRMLHEGMGFGASHVCYSGTTFPLVAEGLKQASRLGFRRLIVLPYFLFDGILVQRVYDAADALQRRVGGGIDILKAEYLGIEKATASVFMQRALEAFEGNAFSNCSMCKYRVPLIGYESEVGKEQSAHRATREIKPYQMHPIEHESFEIIKSGFDWSAVDATLHPLIQRLVHTSGDFDIVDDLFVSHGAFQIGVDALLRCKRIVTDVTMVETGLKRNLLKALHVKTWCGVHDEETALMAERNGITRSAAGIRRAWMQFGNEAVIAIGDAPTAVIESVRLIEEEGWRPQLVIALPVGFVGTRECKEALKNSLNVPRITNRGTRGGSPWAASVVNSMLIAANDKVAGNVSQAT